jgi:hypothetical protein
MAKAKAMKTGEVGSWAFIVGLVIAVVLGVAPMLLTAANTVLLLGILGIIVGLLNIGDKEIHTYLMANIAFLVASGSLLGLAAVIPMLGVYLSGIIGDIVIFVAPGAAIVALNSERRRTENDRNRNVSWNGSA